MRVLFLTKYPPSQASSRYCVYQYLPYFRSQGLECEASPFYDDDAFAKIFRGASLLARCIAFVRCLVIRLLWLVKLGRFDLVVAHRECVPVGPILFERLIKLRRTKFVFIYDDALFVYKRSSKSRLYDLFKSPRKFFTIFKLADLVIGANEYLAQVPRERGANARELRIGEDLQRYTDRNDNRTQSEPHTITLGWIGSPSTEKYLKLIAEPLDSLAKRFPNTELMIVGGGSFKLDRMPVHHHPWSQETEVSNLHKMDIGLMPLPDEQWSLGKSGGKARLYMAVGIVPVATDIGFNRDLIDDYETGRLIENIDDWEESLAELIDNCELRHSLSKGARAKIEARYSVTVTGKQYLEMLHETAGIALPHEDRVTDTVAR